MTIKLQISVLFIAISFFSCNSRDKIIAISDMNKDFSISEELEFKFFNKYDAYNGACSVDDSVLWCAVDEGGCFGSCYDLNTGKRLSTIIMKGKASYELVDFPSVRHIGDSIQFQTTHSVKIFSKKDIVENKPMGERRFSVITIPDSISLQRTVKLPNGSLLATIRPTYQGYNQSRQLKQINQNGINEKSMVVFNANEVKAYEVIKYDSFDVEKLESSREDDPATIEDQIKLSYTNGLVDINDNGLAVFSVADQFMLYLFDYNNGNVVKEKRYTRMQNINSLMINDMGLRVCQLLFNDKYILSLVQGFFSDEDKKARLYKNAIFVFDKDLSPIKRINLPYDKQGNYIISLDCSSVYLCKHVSDSLTLYKADLKL